MTVAARMNDLGTESAFEVLAKARALEAQGKEIIHLEIGEPDFETPRHIVEAGMQAISDGFTHYGPTAGLPELREAIARNSREVRGTDTDPANVVVTPGAKPSASRRSRILNILWVRSAANPACISALVWCMATLSKTDVAAQHSATPNMSTLPDSCLNDPNSARGFARSSGWAFKKNAPAPTRPIPDHCNDVSSSPNDNQPPTAAKTGTKARIGMVTLKGERRSASKKSRHAVTLNTNTPIPGPI